MKFVFSKSTLPKTGAVVAGVLAGRKLTPSAQALDDAMGGGLLRAINAGRFKGKKGQGLSILVPAGTTLDRIYLAGLGSPGDMDELGAQTLGGQIYAALADKGDSVINIAIDKIEECSLSPAEMGAALAHGARLRSYRFDKYRTKEKKDQKPTISTVRILCDDVAATRKRFSVFEAVAGGVFLARNLSSEPANVIYPESMAQRIEEELVPLGVRVQVLDEKNMRKLGLGALLAVGQGSVRESKLVVMEWEGLPKAAKDKKTKKGDKNKTEMEGALAFVGKGVTFDTGGISLKPSANMGEMKQDMDGAAAVVGLMRTLAGRKAKANVVGVIGLAENMPSGQAQRPGDIVTSMSGQTIEVLDTDAEGRLVLSDALWYCKERYKPSFMIDIATLTGAVIVALGYEMAGLFSNDDSLAANIEGAAKSVGEDVWRLPLSEKYDKMLRSDVADMANISRVRGAGSITAAQFLKRFSGDVPWAHLDIAGVHVSKKDTALSPKGGGTAFGVRLLNRLVADSYED